MDAGTAEGSRLILTVAESINKNYQKGGFKLLAVDRAGKEETVADWPFVLLPGAPYKQAIPRMFPWAEVAIDEDYYESYNRDAWEQDCGAWDNEEGKYLLYSEDFSDWAQRLPSGLRPYDNNGEVAHWRLELSLNSLAALFFLEVDEHLAED